MNRNRFRSNRNPNNDDRNKKKPIDANVNSIVVENFQEYANELNDKHDRYERIVKLSRDITIESKRLIFLLHTINKNREEKEKILEQAKTRLIQLCKGQFAGIAKELKEVDQYQYARAYSAGVQEFIEAFTYYYYISGENIQNWKHFQHQLTYKTDKEDETEQTQDEYYCLLQPIEFLLGMADLTGEVMRKCINSLGNGDVDACFDARNILQQIYSCYMSLGPTRNREMGRKISTMRQSVLKVENVCYNVKVRGREAAIWGADDGPDKGNNDDDEGFINY